MRTHSKKVAPSRILMAAIPPGERVRKIQVGLSPKEAERFAICRVRLDLRSNECARVAILKLCDEVGA